VSGDFRAIAGFPRYTGEATFSVGSAAAEYPGSNLGTLPLSYPWRSAGLDPAQTTITATFSRPRRLGLVVIGPHNFSLSATYQVDAYFDAGGTDLMWSSGNIPVWPAVFAETQVDWDGGRWWDRTYTPEEIQGYPWYRPTLIPTPDYARSVRIQIFDPFNPEGYVQAGLVELADALRFPVNPSYGATYGYKSRTETQEADGGTKYRRRRNKPRQFRGTIEYMGRDDALGSFLEMQRQLDVDTPFFWWPDPTDDKHVVRTAFMAHFADLDLQSYAAFDRAGVPVNIEEEL